MATKDIAIACQGGGSHAAYTAGVLPVLLGEFDNLGAARAGPGPAYREPGTPAGLDVPVLAAISGTSGGAISALLGWYGFVTGGAAEARRRLDAFWDANAAARLVEAGVNHWMRVMSDAASMWGWDVESSPYSPLMFGAEMMGGVVWPFVATTLGGANPFMRPQFFSLRELLEPAVDWPLVVALGDFASIPLEVQRWLRMDLQAALYPPDAPCQARYRAERDTIEARIERKLDAARRVRERIDLLELPPDALLRAAFSRWQPPPLRMSRDGLAALAAAVQAATRYIPHLLVGAVELHEGDFVAFSSERAPDDGGISIDAVLASAAVPWLFRAHEMDGLDPDTLAPRRLALWDGLFSQNPPVRNFLSGVLDDAKKPDEIWVVQINPTRARAEPGAPGRTRRLEMAGGEIWDLRNALAGNLALNQEIGFVEAINRRMETIPDVGGGSRGDGHADDHADETAAMAAARWRDKLVQIDRIIMDSDAVEAATGMTLGANSKLDRDPRLKEALCEHGRVQAQRYLALRRQVGNLCGDLAGTLAGACSSAAGLDPDSVEAAACRASPGQGFLVIDGATLYGTGIVDDGAPRALVRWRAIDTQIHARPVRIEGRSELADDVGADGAGGAGGGLQWRVKDVRITAVVPKTPDGGRAAIARLAAWSGPEAGTRPQ